MIAALLASTFWIILVILVAIVLRPQFSNDNSESFIPIVMTAIFSPYYVFVLLLSFLLSVIMMFNFWLKVSHYSGNLIYLYVASVASLIGIIFYILSPNNVNSKLFWGGLTLFSGVASTSMNFIEKLLNAKYAPGGTQVQTNVWILAIATLFFFGTLLSHPTRLLINRCKRKSR